MAKPYMRRLVERTGETVKPVRSQRRKKHSAWHKFEPTNDRLDFAPRRRPRNASVSGGKPCCPNAEGRNYRHPGQYGMPRSTRNTIVSMKRLETELANTRARRYAIDDEEFTLGLRCVSAPIIDGRQSLTQLCQSQANGASERNGERLAILAISSLRPLTL